MFMFHRHLLNFHPLHHHPKPQIINVYWRFKQDIHVAERFQGWDFRDDSRRAIVSASRLATAKTRRFKGMLFRQ